MIFLYQHVQKTHQHQLIHFKQGQNLTAMDDIKFVQNKVLTALRIPKTFLNFEENAGDGKNLALMDIPFPTRTINRIQQAF